ncbi:MAG: hypothetical protein QUS11_05710 [Candidatus Fermentibacter sp.]|nr:hypothetical protein [Candidatus Fermentibacter sp.]
MFEMLLLAALSAPEYPGFVPPPSGMGSEYLPSTVRSAGMGGVSTALVSPDGFSMSNPATSAWSTSTGVTWTAGWRAGDDDAWDGGMRFPSVSVLFPLPWNAVLSAGLSERSRLLDAAALYQDGYRGSLEWEGGLNEACAAFSLRASEWLAFSLGGRGAFGSTRCSASLTETGPGGSGAPVNTQYVDEAKFMPCWGLQAGMLMRLGRVDLGASILTDRGGRIDIDRDYAGAEEEGSSQNYDLPGEVNLGAVVRPSEWLSLGADLHSRKTMHLLDSTVPDGSVLGLGAEALVSRGVAARAGWTSTDGLWRDGASRWTGGLGYRFADGAAGLDFSISRETWDGSGETSVFVSLWSSESWLGNR